MKLSEKQKAACYSIIFSMNKRKFIVMNNDTRYTDRKTATGMHLVLFISDFQGLL